MGRASGDLRDFSLRERARRECARHLKDLQRAHEEPPADVRLRSRPPEQVKTRFTPALASSGASCPAAWFDAF